MAVILMIGNDQVILGDAVGSKIDELIGDGDRSLMLEILGESDYRDDNADIDATRLVVAGGTPPFLTDRRVVVGRALSMFSRKDLYSPIVEMVSNLIDTTDLLLVWEKPLNPQTGKYESGPFPKVPAALKEAVEVAGGLVIDTKVPSGRKAAGWLRDQIASSDLKFERAAVAAVEDLLGQDRSGVVGLLRTLEGALGSGAVVAESDVVTYGGQQGSVAPWDLDDAIDRGDVALAVSLVHRIIPLTSNPSERNGAAFKMLATLSRRYSNMLRLDGAGARNERDAAEMLGMKGTTFPAKKALAQGRRLGHDAISKSIHLLAEADLQLRGTVDFPPELVMELLVARLANIARRG